MGAFWDGWNRQGQINQQQALSGLQQVRGLAGLMQEAQAMQQQQAVRGLLADTSIPDEQKIPALLRAGPAGIEVAGKLMQVQKGQQEAEKARRVENFWQNEAPRYNTPAQDEIRSQALPGGLMGPALPGQGGLLQEAKPAGVDIEGLVRAGAAAGAVSPEAVFRIESDKQNRAAQREAMLESRRMQIEAQIEAARQRGEDARRIAQMQIDGRADLARLAAGLRPPRQEPAPSITQLADPNDPTKTIVVDARTYRGGGVGSPGVLGAGPKMTDAGKADAKTAQRVEGLASDIQQAEDLLMGVKRLPDGQVVPGTAPTASGIGRVADAAGRMVGVSLSGAPEAAALKTVAGRLVSRVPRFEGPQSDKDVQLYKEMAGNVGDESKPVAERLAALRQLKMLYDGYETGQRGRLAGAGASGGFGGAGGTKRIANDAEYNALPKGARYIGPDNIERVKP